MTPTSVTGRCSNAPAQLVSHPCLLAPGRGGHNARRRSGAVRVSPQLPVDAGFSLLEVLVVVFIVGVLATMFTLSVGVIGGDRQLETEADRLVALMKLAREEAVIQGREIGLRFFKDRYEFSGFYEDFVEYHDEENPDQSEWALLDESTLLGPRHLPEGLLFELQIDGRDIVLTRADTEPAAEPAQGEEDEQQTETYNPQVMVFSSGDMSPFTVRIRREYSNAGTTLEFDIDGSVEVEEEQP